MTHATTALPRHPDPGRPETRSRPARVAGLTRTVRDALTRASRHVPVGAQLAGACMFEAGLVMVAGAGIALMVAGLALVALGALREAGRV